MRKHICLIISVLFVSACAFVETGTETDNIPPSGTGHALDRLEMEMRDNLAGSPVSIRREGGLLAITLKGEHTFAAGSSALNPESLRTADQIAAILNKYPQTAIRVEGHTDNRGEETYNLKLSEKRAQNISDLLVERKIDPSRITVTPFGETMPIAPNYTKEGRIRNRRVEIRIELATGNAE